MTDGRNGRQFLADSKYMTVQGMHTAAGTAAAAAAAELLLFPPCSQRWRATRQAAQKRDTKAFWARKNEVQWRLNNRGVWSRACKRTQILVPMIANAGTRKHILLRQAQVRGLHTVPEGQT